MAASSPLRIDVLTLFPDMFQSVLGASILKRAAQDVPDPKNASRIRQAVVEYHLTDIRDFTDNKHSKVDRPPFGGGPGMVIQCQPVWDAVHAAEAADARPATRIVMSPQGEPLKQRTVEDLATHSRLLILAGHYEGFDQRVIDALQPIREISIGDYVLSGGELAAMVLIDAVVRLIPGAVGDEASVDHESFASGADSGGDSGGHSGGALLDYLH